MRYEVSIEPSSICVHGEGKVKKNEATFSELNGETDYVVTVTAYGKKGDACSSEVELKIKTGIRYDKAIFLPNFLNDLSSVV